MISATKNNIILAAWQNTLAERAAAPAIYSVEGGVLRTFADIGAEAALMQEKLSIFKNGNVVAIQIGNKPSWPALFLACLEQGLVLLPLGSHIERAEYEIAVATCHVRGRVSIREGALDFERIESHTSHEPHTTYSHGATPSPTS